MGEKTVSVRLKLAYDQFIKGSKESGKAVEGIGDSATKGTKKAEQSFADMGKRTADLGSRMSSSVTLPVLAAGAAVTSLAISFDNSFQAMRSVAGVADEEIAHLKDSVLALSAETGRGPNELAEGLLAIRSAGVTGAAALEVLEMAGKGAAAGMGDTRDIANALTNVLNAYGTEAISASEAMDVLTMAVTEGKAEASEMAPQFGRLLPLAAELDVSFADVAGTLAYLTRSSGDAAASATMLQGILSKLLKPSLQGEEALRAIGESGNSLRRMLNEEGLLGTLVRLRERMGDSGFNLLFDDIQATQGALQLTGSEMQKAQAVIDNVADSAGAADLAFQKWAESAGAKNAIAFAKFQAAAIRMGDLIMGPASNIISALGDMVEAFSDLPEPVQKLIVGFAGVAAAAGPMLTVGGNIMRLYSGMTGVFTRVGTSATGLQGGLAASATGFAIVAPLVLGAGLALDNYARKKAQVRKETDELADALRKEAAGLEGEADKLFGGRLADGKLGTELKNVNADFKVLTDGIRTSGDELDKMHRDVTHWAFLSEQIDDLAASGNAFGQEMKRIKDTSDSWVVQDLVLRLDSMADQLETTTVESENLAAATTSLGEEQGLTAEQISLVTEALSQQIDTMKRQFDPFASMADALAGVRDAQAGMVESNQKVTESQQALDEAIAAHGPNSAEARDAAQALAEAQNGVTDAQWAAFDATTTLVGAGAELRSALEDQGLSADAVSQKIYELALQAGFTREQALLMAGGVHTVTDELSRVPPLTTATVQVTGTQKAFFDIKSIQDRINALHGRDVGIRIVGTSVGVVLPGGAKLNAEGGIYDKATLGVFGEAGREVILPLTKPGRAMELAQKSGLFDVLGQASPAGSAAAMYASERLMGNLVPQSAYSGGGAVVTVNVSMAGAMVPNSRTAARWVADAWNLAVRTMPGRVNIKQNATTRRGGGSWNS